jgi:hypothetical protein
MAAQLFTLDCLIYLLTNKSPIPCILFSCSTAKKLLALQHTSNRYYSSTVAQEIFHGNSTHWQNVKYNISIRQMNFYSDSIFSIQAGCCFFSVEDLLPYSKQDNEQKTLETSTKIPDKKPQK